MVGDFLSYDPYGVMYRKGDAQLAQLINETFQQLAEDREIERRYKRWFLQQAAVGREPGPADERATRGGAPVLGLPGRGS